MAQGLTSSNGLQLINGVSISENNLDPFSRLRVSDPIGLFSTQTQYDLDPLQNEVGATGTGVTPTHDSNTRMVTISATAGTGVSFLQSYQYSPYQPGKGHLILVTGLLDTGVVGATKDFGYFDSANGVFFRQNGTTNLQLIRRSSTSGSIVDTAVAQSSWNIDKLDGTGASGYTLDPTKVFILVIDLQFLGMGRIRVGFDIDGIFVWAHHFLNANILTVPYMQIATLPIQCLVTSTATGSTATTYFKCATVISEGGFQSDLGYTFSTPEATGTAGSSTRVPILSVRPKTTFNSKTNRSQFFLEQINLAITGNTLVFWELAIGVTFSGAQTYADINTTYSAFEYGINGTYSAVAGLVLASGYAGTGTATDAPFNIGINQRYPLTLDRAGVARTMGTLTLLGTGVGSTSAMRASFTFKEIR